MANAKHYIGMFHEHSLDTEKDVEQWKTSINKARADGLQVMVFAAPRNKKFTPYELDLVIQAFFANCGDWT